MRTPASALLVDHVPVVKQAHRGRRLRRIAAQEKIDALAVSLLSGALKQAGGNQKEAAGRLGLKYHQMRYYLKKHGVS